MALRVRAARNKTRFWGRTGRQRAQPVAHQAEGGEARADLLGQHVRQRELLLPAPALPPQPKVVQQQRRQRLVLPQPLQLQLERRRQLAYPDRRRGLRRRLACEDIVLGRIPAPFPPAVPPRLLLSSVWCYEFSYSESAALRVRAAQTKTRFCGWTGRCSRTGENAPVPPMRANTSTCGSQRNRDGRVSAPFSLPTAVSDSRDGAARWRMHDDALRARVSETRVNESARGR